ncbi:hypothetical protein DB321_06640 [Ligilactobacillus salivarius]|jgi:hypothetical protein|uniref:Uncharacterized protein n=2 Tax=Ligilactobacillus salivarius TaxID=1624 RepID=C2EHW2_9LACO|nr:hypothetical protein [Ligilactobacillus salivarius]ATP37340.1 hypothetical protein CR531_03885 [Ligilactobacillus salivarius]EEJ73881.1 hypothetical protein HMPREF0545_1234 [Ligilactobacillus salivarius DSM 20555 = ATCC 11741]KRM69832.1 hypothetical protein FC55_GL001713 [Ligilactobacillus salivarius DSM 20555 = ATCC 11741]MBE5067615.1 hypothetical protein [Ligilactobacillus salivarius]MBE7938694.1 hypothetical protein [Ligilactobacillus salivarius]
MDRIQEAKKLEREQIIKEIIQKLSYKGYHLNRIITIMLDLTEFKTYEITKCYHELYFK